MKNRKNRKTETTHKGISFLSALLATICMTACSVETPDPMKDLADLMLLNQLLQNPSRFGFSSNRNLGGLSDTNNEDHSGNGFSCDTGGKVNNCIVPSFHFELVGHDGKLIQDARITVSLAAQTTELTPVSAYNPVYICEDCAPLAQGKYVTDLIGETITIRIQQQERGIDAPGPARITRQPDSISLNGDTIYPDSLAAFLNRDGGDQISWNLTASNPPSRIAVELRDGSIFLEDVNFTNVILPTNGSDGAATIRKDLSHLDSTAYGGFGHAVGLSEFSWVGTQPESFAIYDAEDRVHRNPSGSLYLESACNQDNTSSYSCDNPDSLVNTDLIIY